jgi:hypothetical protein
MKTFVPPLSVLGGVVMCFLAVPRVGAQAGGVSLTPTFCLSGTPCVTTYHNDNSRAGVNPNETVFSPRTRFDKLSSLTYPTDGLIYAQPLFIKGLKGSNGTVAACAAPANIVFVATENNSVYAVEGQSIQPPVANSCWQIHLNHSGETAIPYTSLPNNGQGVPCHNILPQLGITGTPVIDTSVTPPVMYVVTRHQNMTTGAFAERLHAIDTTTGLELEGSPFDVGAALSSLGFNIIRENQRAGLALTHPPGSPNLANVYVAWTSNCDFNTLGDYDGWVAGFQLNYNNLSSGFSLLGSFITEPTSGAHEGGIWMAGSAPAIDSSGNVYVAVGNGDWAELTKTNFGWGNSVLKLPNGLGPQPLDFYTPNNYGALVNGGAHICFARSCPPGPTHTIAPDTDMGTGGVVLLSPTQLVSVGKQGMLYVIPYDTSTHSSTAMGGLDGCGYNCSSGSNPQKTACTTGTGQGKIAQCFEATRFNNAMDNNGIWGAPAFWSAGGSNQYLFGIGLHDRMYWYKYSAPKFNTSHPPESDHQFNQRSGGGHGVGGTASITWNGTSASSGVAWALDSNGFGRPGTEINAFQASAPAVLYVYPASPGAAHCNGYICELWDSTQLRNNATVMPGAVKFTVPTIVGGYILIGGGSPGYFGASSTACPPPTNPPFTCAGQLTILH